MADDQSRDILAAFLSARDIPCPSCGYNVRDLVNSRCPECGLELAVRLSLAEPRTGRYIAAVMALTLCGGGFALFFLIIMLISMREGIPGRRDFFYWAVIYPAATGTLHLAALTLLLRARGRRWFRALPSAASRTVARACVTAAACSILAWVVWMFSIMP